MLDYRGVEQQAINAQDQPDAIRNKAAGRDDRP